MRYLFSLFIATILAFSFACGGSAKKAQKPKKSDIPWENLAPAERNYYEDVLACPEATGLVGMILEWELAVLEDVDNPHQIGKNRFWAFRRHQLGIGEAIVQFRVEEQGNVVVEAVLVYINGTKMVLFDYYVTRALRAGKVTLDDENNILYAKATGKYFCGYQPQPTRSTQ